MGEKPRGHAHSTHTHDAPNRRVKGQNKTKRADESCGMCRFNDNKNIYCIYVVFEKLFRGVRGLSTSHQQQQQLDEKKLKNAQCMMM